MASKNNKASETLGCGTIDLAIIFYDFYNFSKSLGVPLEKHLAYPRLRNTGIRLIV